MTTSASFAQVEDPALTQRLRYLANDIEDAGYAFLPNAQRGAMFVARKELSALRYRLEIVDRVYTVNGSVSIDHSLPYFKSLATSPKKGGGLEAKNAADSAFISDLATLANNVEIHANADNTFVIVEKTGEPKSFFLAHQPDLRHNSSLRGQVASPLLGLNAEEIIVVDIESRRIAEVISEFAHKVNKECNDGWKLISIGVKGLVFKQSGAYKLSLFQSGNFTDREISAVAAGAIVLQEPDWCRPRSTFVISMEEDRRDLLVALTVCSKSEWKGKYGFTANPALWAIPH